MCVLGLGCTNVCAKVRRGVTGLWDSGLVLWALEPNSYPDDYEASAQITLSFSQPFHSL